MTEVSDKAREMRLRRKAKRLDHRIEKSRCAWSINNRGGYQIVDGYNTVVDGTDYDLSLNDVEYRLGQIREAA